MEQQMDREFVRRKVALELAIRSMGDSEMMPYTLIDKATVFLTYLQGREVSDERPQVS